jgi:hypothetical protein
MTKRLSVTVIAVLLGGLLLAQIAAAVSSPNYRLDWFTPLTTGGGGAAGSASYAVDYSIGQTASKASSSANYRVGLGYWAGFVQYSIYLPLVLRQ